MHKNSISCCNSDCRKEIAVGDTYLGTNYGDVCSFECYLSIAKWVVGDFNDWEVHEAPPEPKIILIPLYYVMEEGFKESALRVARQHYPEIEQGGLEWVWTEIETENLYARWILTPNWDHLDPKSVLKMLLEKPKSELIMKGQPITLLNGANFVTYDHTEYRDSNYIASVVLTIVRDEKL
ncbi:hypothetical protein SP15_220 [Bacillus phage SP-15]|uniref:Uncharacterized protein n=1 Tax=Bacillus phage SP-15 TaxID=1792032 RepID=A0A127AZ13_9CAUD|nr:hypothetical protein SP15_220 [Bacillus phage SP-15]AMM45021.1 hypothetical protein SP15_220 [Bacillus phage SP-15]